MFESAACRDGAVQEMISHNRRETSHGRRPWSTRPDWERTHGELSRLARSRSGLDYEEGGWLLAAWRGSVHARLGYGSFREYIERLFGYGARVVQEKLRVAEAIEELLVSAEALKNGQVCWSVLRELTRVATPETEAEWLEVAAGRTVREVEQLVSGRGPGSRPGDARDASKCRHVLRFEVSAEVLASVREALGKDSSRCRRVARRRRGTAHDGPGGARRAGRHGPCELPDGADGLRELRPRHSKGWW